MFDTLFNVIHSKQNTFLIFIGIQHRDMSLSPQLGPSIRGGERLRDCQRIQIHLVPSPICPTIRTLMAGQRRWV